MATNKIKNWRMDVPIVNSDGTPTLEFLRVLLDKDDVLATEEGASAAAAAASAAAAANATAISNLELDDLTDVDTTTTPPVDGDALVYNSANTPPWGPSAVAASGGGGGTYAFHGAKVYRSADQTANWTTSAAIGWTAEVFDTDNFHDTSTNNTRFTIPAGVSKVRVSANVYVTNFAVSTQFYMYFTVNGSPVTPYSATRSDNNDGTHFGVHQSEVIEVVEGDYIEVWINTSTDTSVTLSSARSFFQIEVIDGSLATGALYDGGSFEAVQTDIPDASSLATWDNQGTSSRSAYSKGIVISTQIDSLYHAVYEAAPTAPYDYYMRMDNVGWASSGTTSYIDCGLAFRSSGGKYVSLIWQKTGPTEGGLFYVRRFTAINTISSTPVGVRYSLTDIKWFRVNNDGTNLTFYVSIDGVNWITVYTETIAAFMGDAASVAIITRASNVNIADTHILNFGTTAPAPSSVYGRGTSFPSSPTDGQRFYRTDLNMVCFYDGTNTQWLSEQIFTVALVSTTGGFTATTAYTLPVPYYGVHSVWLESMDTSSYRTAAGQWDWVLSWRNSSNADTVIATRSGASDATTTWVAENVSIGSVLSASAVALAISPTEVSGAATFYGGAWLNYRLIVT